MLTREGCRRRLDRFLHRLDEAGIPGALISHPRDIYYLTGLLPEHHFQYPNLLFVGPGRRSWLVTGREDGEAVVDETIRYSPHVFYTFNPDNHRRAAGVIAGISARERGLASVGHQREALPRSLATAFQDAAGPADWVEIDAILQDLQLRKDPDEVACIRRAIRSSLAGYSRAQQVIAPGVTELEVATECQAAAQRWSGRVHFYSGDFQSGNPGGFARDRPIRSGEIYIIDAWSDVGGYWSDMSRAWIVGGSATAEQRSAFDHLASLLASVRERVRPGVSTSAFWRDLDSAMREHPLMPEGLTHHGGHGVGLRGHEGPDLNRDRGGVFEVGNVFTVEPGYYHPSLNAGIRLENVFHLTEAGVEVLSEYPVHLDPDPDCLVPAREAGPP